MTLPSNVINEFYDRNTIGDYKTKLPQFIDFGEEKWAVALVEISYTKSWHNVGEADILLFDKDNNLYYYLEQEVKQRSKREAEEEQSEQRKFPDFLPLNLWSQVWVDEPHPSNNPNIQINCDLDKVIKEYENRRRIKEKLRMEELAEKFDYVEIFDPEFSDDEKREDKKLLREAAERRYKTYFPNGPVFVPPNKSQHKILKVSKDPPNFIPIELWKNTWIDLPNPIIGKKKINLLMKNKTTF